MGAFLSVYIPSLLAQATVLALVGVAYALVYIVQQLRELNDMRRERRRQCALDEARKLLEKAKAH